MRVTCNACHAVHDIAPPPWVVASGRPFGMQCARCGARQEVHPIGLQLLDDGSSGTYPGLGPVLVDGTPVARSTSAAPQGAGPVNVPPVPAAPAWLDGPAKHVPGATLVDDALPESEESLSMPVPFGRAKGHESDSETTLEMSAVHVHERTAVAPDQDGDTLSDADDPMPAPAEVVTPSGAALLADLERDLSSGGDSGGDPAEVLDATAPAVPPEAIVPLRDHADELTTPPRGEGDFVLLQGGEMFDVVDLATVQRWVIERRVDADDHLSFRAGPWQRAGDLESLSVFFEAVAEIEAHGGGQVASVRRPPRRPWTGLTGLGAPERTEESAAYPAIHVGLDHLDAPPVPEHLKGRAVVVPSEEDAVTFGRTRDEHTEEMGATMAHSPASMAASVAQTRPIAASAAEASFGVGDEDDDAERAVAGASAMWMFGAAAVVTLIVLAIWWVAEGSGGPVTMRPPPSATAVAPSPSGSEVAAPAPVPGAAEPAGSPVPVEAAPVAAPPVASSAPPVAAPAAAVRPAASPSSAPRMAAPTLSTPPPRPTEPPPGPVAHLNLPTPARSLTAPPPTDGPSPWDAPASPPPSETPAWETRSAPPSEGPVAAVDSTARVAALVDQGWTALDAGNASSAADLFEQATSLMPGSVDANYGLGYAYVKQGRNPEAQVRLCKARARAGTADKREIEAVLQNAGLSCE